jgi:hypothetical protein
MADPDDDVAALRAEVERLRMQQARWEEAEESGFGWKARAELAEDRIQAAWGEIEHAYLNGHRLDSSCQGAFGDQRDAAVRVSSLAAALTRKAPGL